VDEVCKVGGKSFQTRGLETAKLYDPYIIVLVLGTIRCYWMKTMMASAGSNQNTHFCQIRWSCLV